ncbi:MAG: energy-coupling factor ABC transporter permease [Magnetococcales bacterium]|nr:energy-coupling factor ABC transporter permease [Magnetococcales bacterium]
MHMSDALLSAEIGAGFWLASGTAIAVSARKLQATQQEAAVPMMGVMGAFIFAAQMINFTIPGTGSSGHLAGGMLISILLGSHAAFLGMASVLVVQAFFFADGGLLALGANIFNMGVIPCYLVFPLIFRPFAGASSATSLRWRMMVFCSAILAVQLGALGVVLETRLSGIAELPLTAFLLAMQPIHLAIGVVEGLVTVTVLQFLRQARPNGEKIASFAPTGNGTLRPRMLMAVGAVALLTGVVVSWFASTHPDGLEWSIARLTGESELGKPADGAHQTLAQLQERIAPMPDYAFKKMDGQLGRGDAPWGTPDAGKSLAGLVGGLLTLVLLLGVGWMLRRRSGTPTPPSSSMS